MMNQEDVKESDGSISDDYKVVTIKGCGHQFHKTCLEQSLKQHKNECPTCKASIGVKIGNQPGESRDAKCDMTWSEQRGMFLPGHSAGETGAVGQYY